MQNLGGVSPAIVHLAPAHSKSHGYQASNISSIRTIASLNRPQAGHGGFSPGVDWTPFGNAYFLTAECGGVPAPPGGGKSEVQP